MAKVDKVKVDDKVLQPITTSTTTTVSASSVSDDVVLQHGQCLISIKDKKGLPVDIVCSIRMWEQVYSKQDGAQLKKKHSIQVTK